MPLNQTKPNPNFSADIRIEYVKLFSSLFVILPIFESKSPQAQIRPHREINIVSHISFDINFFMEKDRFLFLSHSYPLPMWICDIYI